MGGAARADNSNGMMIAIGQLAPDVEDNWRGVNFAQRFRIGWRVLSDNGRAKFANAFQLRDKIDSRFPIADLLSDFIADSFNSAKFAALCRQYSLRIFDNLEQFAQPHRTDGRQHVERNASFREGHDLTALTEFWRSARIDNYFANPRSAAIKMESRRRLGRMGRRTRELQVFLQRAAVVRFPGNRLQHHRRQGGRRLTAWFRQQRAASFAFDRSVYRPKNPFADGLR